MHNIRLAAADPISPIRVSPKGRYFVDPAGHPVFWLGDTQWELFRLFSPEGALRILRDRQVKGFNLILIMLLGVTGWHCLSPVFCISTTPKSDEIQAIIGRQMLSVARVAAGQVDALKPGPPSDHAPFPV